MRKETITKIKFCLVIIMMILLIVQIASLKSVTPQTTILIMLIIVFCNSINIALSSAERVEEEENTEDEEEVDIDNEDVPDTYSQTPLEMEALSTQGKRFAGKWLYALGLLVIIAIIAIIPKHKGMDDDLFFKEESILSKIESMVSDILPFCKFNKTEEIDTAKDEPGNTDMFAGVSDIDISEWDVSKVQDISIPLQGISAIDMSEWDVSKVSDVSGIFAGMPDIDISKDLLERLGLIAEN